MKKNKENFDWNSVGLDFGNWEEEKIWEVVVVGGGPAGMMAAGRAAEAGRSVLLLEKNSTLGKKLLLTGHGRCNFTNNKPTLRALLAEYKTSAKYLFSAFSQFGPTDTIEFFNRLGVKSKEESEGRVFPVSDKAETILGALVKYLKDNKATIQTSAAVTDINFNESKKLFKISLQKGPPAFSKTCIVAVGGKAQPQTGATGEGFVWLKKLGHKIIPSQPALVPVKLSDSWVKNLSGLALKDVGLSAFGNRKLLNVNGDLLFTHFGLSGPMVLNASRKIGELLKQGQVVLSLDLLPRSDAGELKQNLQKLLAGESNKKIKSSLGKIILPALSKAVLNLAEVDKETFNHSLTKEARQKLLIVIKSLPLHVGGLMSAEQAVYSSGGVPAKEVNFKTMASRLVPNLFIIGDALDIERPSGGYSLQLCWTTGYVAGNSCLSKGNVL